MRGKHFFGSQAENGSKTYIILKPQITTTISIQNPYWSQAKFPGSKLKRQRRVIGKLTQYTVYLQCLEIIYEIIADFIADVHRRLLTTRKPFLFLLRHIQGKMLLCRPFQLNCYISMAVFLGLLAPCLIYFSV